LAASVEPSANIRQSVVGAAVEVGKGVTLDRCVVWPGTTVSRSATNAVITPEHRIEIS
jgi:ADP-glucose pyrophosphorylase